jgi:CPA2 family monovalent cation:H+ antiporter-2
LSGDATNVVIGAAIISITVNPLLFRAIEPLGRKLARRDRQPVVSQTVRRQTAEMAALRAVVVGYGPIGRVVTRLLRENDITPTVVEMNVDTVRELRLEGINAIYGDATQTATLAAARIGEAESFIISVAGLSGIEESLRVARQLNPTIQILARATHLREVRPLRRAGADFVASGEGEVALAFTAAFLERLGATPEQIDRERARARQELA